MNFKRFLVLGIVLISSCSVEDGVDGINGVNGINGINGQDGYSIGLVSTTTEEGCQELSFYKDLNNNGSQDSGEAVINSFVICDGRDGADGADGVDGVDGQDGADGADGQDAADGVDGTNGVDGQDGANGNSIGVSIVINEDGCNELTFFIDLNANNVQEEGEEIISTILICNGADGADGADGVDGTDGADGTSYVFVFSDASDCPNGGIKVSVYKDNDSSGTYTEGDTLSQTTSHCFEGDGVSVSNFYIDSNGYTVKCPNAKIGEKGIIDGKEYVAVDNSSLQTYFDTGFDPSCLCTTNVTSLEYLYYDSVYTQGHILDSEYDISNWDTSNVVMFSRMLSDAPSDFNQNVGKWNVQSGIDFSSLFSGLRIFNQDLSNWDVSSGLDFSQMFSNASNFNQDISGWDTNNALKMNQMFLGATSFNQDLSNWDVTNVYSCYEFSNDTPSWTLSQPFFELCDAIIVSENGHTLKIRDGIDYQAGDVFWYQGGPYTVVDNDLLRQFIIEGKDLTRLITTLVTDMSYLFQEIDFEQYRYLYLYHWDTSNVTNMRALFYEFISYEQIEGLQFWDTSSVENMGGMFYGLASFNSNISNWNTSNTVDMDFMFFGAESFNQDIGGWDTSSVSDMSRMFQGANSFNQDINSWDTSNVTSMQGMLAARSFNKYIGDWDVSSVENMANMFSGAESFNQDINSWDTSSVQNMSAMFLGASSFNQDISSWDVSSVINMSGMFVVANSFNQDIGNWSVSSVQQMVQMFAGNQSFNQNISNWDTSTVVNMQGMFLDATVFNQNLSSWNVENVISCQGFSLRASSWTEPKPNFTNCDPN